MLWCGGGGNELGNEKKKKKKEKEKEKEKKKKKKKEKTTDRRLRRYDNKHGQAPAV
jgi:hypothetical protein